MTEFRVETVRIGAVEKHPNADTLSITMVHGGYPVCFKTGTFAKGDLATYVPVDAMVPVSRKEFAFLDAGKGRTHERVRAKKLRGIFSMGLLVEHVKGTTEGDYVAAHYGVLKYETPEERRANATQAHNAERRAKKSETVKFDRRVVIASALTAGAGIGAAAGLDSLLLGLAAPVVAALTGNAIIQWNRDRNKKPNIPVYDIEGLRRHGLVFQDGEEVWVTEKIHGCNAAFVHTGKRFFVRSRIMFREDVRGDPGPNREEKSDDVWWLTAKRYGLEAKLEAHPNLVLFGEVYGEVQDLRYGVPADERVRFVAFDAIDLKTRKYLDADSFIELCRTLDIPVVPTLYRGPYSSGLADLAEGKTTMVGASHVREGIVIKPVVERHDMRLGRVFLKLAGEGYHLRNETTPAKPKPEARKAA